MIRHQPQARGIGPRAIRLGICICICALAPAGSASAQTPAADPYEPNDSAQTATAIEPRQPYSATIVAAADVDWYRIDGSAPSWQKFFASGDRRIAMIAERTQDSCADRSLRITLYRGSELVTSAPVYPGPSGNPLTLDAEPGASYSLQVDAALDPACAGPVPYAIRAEPYEPPPPPVLESSGAPVKYAKNATKCDVYRDKGTQLRNRIRDLSKKKKAASRKQRSKRLKRIRLLRSQLRSANRSAKGFC